MHDTEVVAAALSLIERGARSVASLEDQRLEFKTDEQGEKESHQDLAEAAVCFANASGGTIIVGVADSVVGVSAFVGSRLKADSLRSPPQRRTPGPPDDMASPADRPLTCKAS